MAKPWSGDGIYYLPARKIEPYRLWFEFLKCAHQDPEVEVDFDHYAEWGDFVDKSFSDWWSGETWRCLFAVDASVRVLNEMDSIPVDPHGFVIRVPISKDRREVLKDIEQLLDQYAVGVKLQDAPRGKFALTEGFEKAFLKYLNRYNMYLRFYKYWLQHPELDSRARLENTACLHYDWAKSRDDMIRSKGYKYPRPFLPFAIQEYAEAIRDGQRGSAVDHRRQCVRYLDKARNLARNAGMGVFPGKF